MRVGLIFECGPRGADKKVCEYLASKLRPDDEFRSLTLANKANLLIECGDAATSLLNDGCERVIIIWDLYPPWRETKPCLKHDREAIFAALTAAGVATKPVFLVAIIEELEAWLLADTKAIEAILSTRTRLASIAKVRNPVREGTNPKKLLNRLFQQHLHRPTMTGKMRKE